VENNKMIAERMMDEGYDVVETSLPALITVVKEINEPRLPSLKGKMKAKNLKPPAWNAQEIGADPNLCGLKGSPTKVVRIFPPAPRGQREILSGSIEEQVATVAKKLKEQSFL
ncbi:MAG TPA: electron transfer flavoprotein subunit beta, partial [Nitrospirota bacterium]